MMDFGAWGDGWTASSLGSTGSRAGGRKRATKSAGCSCGAAKTPKRRKARRTRSSSSARSSSPKRKRAKSSTRPARLVKGSAAAKAYMAKIRKMRGGAPPPIRSTFRTPATTRPIRARSAFLRGPHGGRNRAARMSTRSSRCPPRRLPATWGRCPTFPAPTRRVRSRATPAGWVASARWPIRSFARDA